MRSWLEAFLLTELVEIPIYLAFASSLPLPRRFLFAFGASAITHPLVWLIVLSGVAPYPTLVLGAEAFAVAGEAMFGRALGLRQAWLAAAVANLASVVVGAVLSNPPG